MAAYKMKIYSGSPGYLKEVVSDTCLKEKSTIIPLPWREKAQEGLRYG